jgi:flagellar motility protein MotE (MotC chaperone)
MLGSHHSLVAALVLVGSSWFDGADAIARAETAAPVREESSPVIDYCLNVSDKAADSRVALQTATLKGLEGELDEKIKALEAKRIEVQAWVEKQQQLLTAAEAGLVEIYAKMDPEAAAAQLASVDTRLASSVLRQLKPRDASAILNEMKSGNAAELVKVIAAAAKQESKPK